MMSTIKVCFNTFWFSFDCPGGGEIQLLQTKSALERLGLSVNLFDHWKPELKRFDLVHSFTVQPGMSYFCENVKRLKIPLVISPIFWPPLGASRGEMWEIERGLRFADLILPNSKAEADLLSNVFQIDPKKFHVVYNAVDLNCFKKQDAGLFREKYLIENEFFLCVGNVEPRKNQLSVLKALEKLDKPFHFICVGQVRDPDYFEACKQFKAFRHVGALPYADPLLCSAYSAATGMVLVSSFETPGLSALEALHLGCPVLVTERGSTKEYFGESASYANPDDIESIRVGLSLLSSRPKIENFDMSRFTWDGVALETKQAYLRVLA